MRVSEDGLLTGVAGGNVIVTATWMEQNVTGIHSVEVTAAPVMPTNKAEITFSGDPVLFINSGYKPFNAKFYDENDVEITLAHHWTVEVPANPSLESKILSIPDGNGERESIFNFLYHR